MKLPNEKATAGIPAVIKLTKTQHLYHLIKDATSPRAAFNKLDQLCEAAAWEAMLTVQYSQKENVQSHDTRSGYRQKSFQQINSSSRGHNIHYWLLKLEKKCHIFKRNVVLWPWKVPVSVYMDALLFPTKNKVCGRHFTDWLFEESCLISTWRHQWKQLGMLYRKWQYINTSCLLFYHFCQNSKKWLKFGWLYLPYIKFYWCESIRTWWNVNQRL